jgi:hypothetical protein
MVNEQIKELLQTTLDTLREVSKILIANRTNSEVLAVGIAFSVEAEKLMRLSGHTDQMMAEYYYRVADEAVLKMNIPPIPAP